MGRKRRWVKWAAGGLVLGLALAAGVLSVLARRAEPFLRARIVEALAQHFHARVELDGFHIALSGGLWAEGSGLRIWPPQSPSGPPHSVPARPLIRLDQFRFRAPLRYRPGQPIEISTVQLKGLHIFIPPKSSLGRAVAAGPQPAAAGAVRFQVDSLVCSGGELVMGTDKPGKLPLTFAIAHLRITNAGSSGPISFDAQFTIPRPAGTIHATGTFGPWQVADPGESPLAGRYTFDRADLSVFKGIAGILTSAGRYQGTLRELTVDGKATVPDFRLTHFDHALPLATQFHARVDGTTGDTWLEPVQATLGRSSFSAQGQIVRLSAGHDIALQVRVPHGRVEDFLQLASRSSAPLLTGDLALDAALHIPPGPAPIHERLALHGSFTLTDARFTSAKIQNRMAELSLRGQGRPDEIKTTDPASIRARVTGTFQLAAGLLTLPALDYSVRGAEIQMQGSYALDGGALHFVGAANMKATLSQMVGGWKGLLLKPADRFFQKNGAGARIPITIGGTRDDPQVAIDFSRINDRPSSAQ